MTDFQKHHYVVIAGQIAEALKTARSEGSSERELAIAGLCGRLAGVFQCDNPLFDMERFKKACTIDEN